MATKRKAKKAKPNLFVWLRSGLRSLSRKHAPIYEALADAKVLYRGKPSDIDYNPRQRFAYTCALCGCDFPAKGVAVDHRVDCGTLTCWDDVAPFMQRLFCEKSGLDILCHTCHDAKTFASKYDVTMEEAFLQKKVIALIKGKTAKQLLAYLREYGYDGVSCSNAEKRKKLVEGILRGEN